MCFADQGGLLVIIMSKLGGGVSHFLGYCWILTVGFSFLIIYIIIILYIYY